MHFEWDDHKAAINEHKHGITFDEALSCFYDPLQVAFYVTRTIVTTKIGRS